MKGNYLEGRRVQEAHQQVRMHRNRSNIEKARQRSCQEAAREISAGIAPLSVVLRDTDH